MAALELARQARLIGIGIVIRLFEAEAFGGGPAGPTASPRCQGWFHRGALYALTQPQVALALQRSARSLERLAPAAFCFPMALAVQLAGHSPPAENCFAALDIGHHPCSPDLLRAYHPGVTLPADSRAWRILDGQFDLTLLSRQLCLRALALGVELCRCRVSGLRLKGDLISGMHLEGGQQVAVGPSDVVVLACGAHLRPLLATAGLALPGLRLFRSHLAASDTTGVRALVAVLGGGVNCVPHEYAAGRLLNIFGDSRRVEIPPDEDAAPVRVDRGAVLSLCRDVEIVFGLRLPNPSLSWAAVKTGVIAEGTHSQLHHACRLSGVSNGWVGVPGKLSQSAACASDLARQILRGTLGTEFARPVWEWRTVPKSGSSAA